jgi:PAS domain S-box-containing protein
MRGSIRKRLTLFSIGLAIGPLLLVGIILAWQSFTTQEQQALNLQHEVARRISTEVKAFLDGLESELRIVGQMQGLQKLDRGRQRDTLAELLSYQDAFESLTLLDGRGQEQVHVARSSVLPIELGNRAKADEFVIPQTSGQTYYSPVHFNETTGEPFITIAVPLVDVRTGLVDGVLVSEVRLQRIWGSIMDLQTGRGQSVYIVDAQNKVVAHRNPSVVLRGTTFHVPDQDGIHPGLTGSSVVLAVDKIRLGGQELNIIAEQTVAESLALAVNTILITMSLMVGALVISVVLGLVIVRQIVQPIQAMATTAEAISAGDFSRQVQVTSRDEVGVLAAAFNSMTAQLRQSLEDLEQEVVEVRQAEESLRRANETLQALIDYSPLAIIMLDLDSHVLLWNNAAEKMYGWTAQEALGQFPPFFTEDKREEQRMIFERVAKGEVFTNLELERRRKDDSRILIGASIAPLRDSTGNVYAQVSMATDITEQKKAEQALRESEEKLRQIASSLREVIWLRDAKTRHVLYVNSAFEELTGRTCESFYEDPDIVVNAIHPDDKERVIKALDQRLEGIPYNQEHRFIHLNGSVRWVASRSFPVRNEDGEVFRWTTIMEDITARKLAQEEVKRLNAELEQRVIERTAQLEAANKELEAFSYSVSHDLRAPLRHIDGFLELLRETTTTTLDKKSQRYMTVISDSAKRMGLLIDDLLSFSRMGRTEMSKSQVDLNELIHDVIQEFMPEAEGRDFDWQIATLPLVTGDRAMLRMVLVNLISNALKFTRSRKITQIEIGYEKENETEVVISIRDNGVGFDMKYADKLFGVFQRLHRQADFEGTGIGLANVRRIVNRHGGRTWAEGEVDRGATFYFSLPTSNQNRR